MLTSVYCNQLEIGNGYVSIYLSNLLSLLNDYYAKLIISRHCMKDKLVKGKKRRINWNTLRIAMENTELNVQFFAYCSDHKNKNFKSINRKAYNFLKSYYSTATMRSIKRTYEHTMFSYDDLVQLINIRYFED